MGGAKTPEVGAGIVGAAEAGTSNGWGTPVEQAESCGDQSWVSFHIVDESALRTLRTIVVTLDDAHRAVLPRAPLPAERQHSRVTGRDSGAECNSARLRL